jgi:hypothetical protein
MNFKIASSVGHSGTNNALDVKLVKALLNVYQAPVSRRSRSIIPKEFRVKPLLGEVLTEALGLRGYIDANYSTTDGDQPPLVIDGTAGEPLNDSIARFQRDHMKVAAPDRLITPGSATFISLRKLLHFRYTRQAVPPPSRGVLTWESEGTEGGPNHSRVAHVPTKGSGVTIGRGYDMKERNEAAVQADLTSAGVPAATARSFAGGARLAGSKAEEFIFDNELLDLEITAAAQLSLFKTVYVEYVKKAKRLTNSFSAQSVDWNLLDARIQDVLVDLGYRGDFNLTNWLFLQEHVVKNDFDAFAQEISNDKKWPKLPPDRLKRRKEYVK